MDETRRQSQKQQKEKQKKQEQDGASASKKDDVKHEDRKALTITHMQGPFLLLFFGLAVATVSFLAEMLFGYFKQF